MIKGIDVSSHQGSIDWAAVRAGGVKFAVIRASFGAGRRDKRLEENLKGCGENGLPYGFYHYSYALTPEEAEEEAEFFLEAVKNSAPKLPLYFDFEEKEQRALPIEEQLEIIEAFCERVEAGGYRAGLYGSKSWLEILKRARPELLEKYSVWVAQWNDRNTFSGRYDLWQNSSAGRVPGIETAVDTDFCYLDLEGEELSALRERVAKLSEKLSSIAKIASEAAQL